MFIGALIRAFHRSARRPGAAHLAQLSKLFHRAARRPSAAHLARLSSRFHRSARRPSAAHLALPPLQAFEIGGVVAAGLLDGVAPQLLQETGGPDGPPHPPPPHARPRPPPARPSPPDRPAR